MNSTIGNRSIFERVFHLSERGTTLRTELIAGATTFLSCVSIMVLNPTILAAAGMDQKAVFWATALSSCIGCLWIGLWGNFPFALGPAMGLHRGTGHGPFLAERLGVRIYIRLCLYAFECI